MRARALPAAVLLGAVAALVAAPDPAHAQSSCGLSITAPGAASASQPTALGAAQVTVPLGQVQVCVTARTLSTTSFTVKVKTGGFVTGGGSAVERIAPEAVTYTRGSTSVTPLSLSLDGCSSSPFAMSSTEQVVASCGVLGVLGDAYVSWRPTLSVDVSGARIAGTYTGTITHSVA